MTTTWREANVIINDYLYRVVVFDSPTTIDAEGNNAFRTTTDAEGNPDLQEVMCFRADDLVDAIATAHTLD